jgi:hypothetical protein
MKNHLTMASLIAVGLVACTNLEPKTESQLETPSLTAPSTLNTQAVAAITIAPQPALTGCNIVKVNTPYRFRAQVGGTGPLDRTVNWSLTNGGGEVDGSYLGGQGNLSSTGPSHTFFTAARASIPGQLSETSYGILAQAVDNPSAIEGRCIYAKETIKPNANLSTSSKRITAATDATITLVFSDNLALGTWTIYRNDIVWQSDRSSQYVEPDGPPVSVTVPYNDGFNDASQNGTITYQARVCDGWNNCAWSNTVRIKVQIP